jgi:hypothetical protein
MQRMSWDTKFSRFMSLLCGVVYFAAVLFVTVTYITFLGVHIYSRGQLWSNNHGILAQWML